VKVLDGSHELGVGFDRLFDVHDIAVEEIDRFVDFLHLGGEALDESVVK